MRECIRGNRTYHSLGKNHIMAAQTYLTLSRKKVQPHLTNLSQSNFARSGSPDPDQNGDLAACPEACGELVAPPVEGIPLEHFVTD